MWHHLETVATDHGISPEEFRAFVEQVHSNKLDGSGMLSTWDVNEIVASFNNVDNSK